MAKKFFSIKEAEAVLPTISPLVNRAQVLKEALERHEQVTLRQRVMTDGSEESIEFGEYFDSELTSLKERFYNAVEKIESSGAVIRDIDQGLVDFYTRFEGREVFLSWREGEQKIRFWHEPHDGAAGRKRILELK